MFRTAGLQLIWLVVLGFFLPVGFLLGGFWISRTLPPEAGPEAGYSVELGSYLAAGLVWLILAVSLIREKGRVLRLFRESEEEHQLLVELGSTFTYSTRIEPDGQLVVDELSEGSRVVTGYDVRELEAQGGWAMIIPPEDLPSVNQRILNALAGKAEEGETRIRTKTGELRWVRFSTRPITDPVTNRVCRIRGAVQDITARRLAEEEHHRLKLLFEAVLQQMPAGVRIIEPPEGKLVFGNAAMSRIFRQPIPAANRFDDYSQLRGSTLEGRPLKSTEWPAARALLYGDTTLGEEIAIERGDQTRGIIRVNAAPIHDAEGRRVAAVSVIDDVTEHREATEELRASRERLHALSARLVEVQESEKRRIARELHDEVGQALTGLKLILDLMALKVEGSPQRHLAEAQDLVDLLLKRIRLISLDLRPAMLDDLGLLPAMLGLFERYAAQTGVQVRVKHVGLERRFPLEVETTAFRIIQEALTNVARHAGASEVLVRAWTQDNSIHLQVIDHGRGFDPESARLLPHSGGLTGMEERAALVGGSVVVESGRGKGTFLTAELPFAGGAQNKNHATPNSTR